MSDVVNMILGRAGDGHVEGSFQITADCGHECMVAPSGKKVLDDPNVETKTQCLRCAMQDPKVLETIVEKGLVATRDAREELNREIGVGNVDQLFARFKVKEVDLDHP